MSEVGESDFTSDDLRDYEKYIIDAVLDESFTGDPNDDIFTPRCYQDELVDHVEPANRIVFVPLERDKLHISASYIKYLTKENSRKILYVVQSLSEMISCVEFFGTHLPLNVTSLSPDVIEEDWQRTYDCYEVFIVLADIFSRMVSNCSFEICKIDLYIFSECFHQIEECVSRQFLSSKILVFTSTFNFTGENSAQFYDWLKKLEITFDSCLISSRSCSLSKKYLSDSVVKSVKFTPTSESSNSSSSISQIRIIISDLYFVVNSLNDDFGAVDSIRDMLKNLENCIQNYGLYPAYVVASSHQIELEKLRLRYNQSHIILSSIISDFNSIRCILELELSKNNKLNDAKSIINHSGEKIVKLISLLYRMDFQDNCVIFVEDYKVALMITYIFDKLSETNLMPNVAVSCVIDSSSNDCNSEREGMLRNKFKRSTLKKFYKGTINVLVVPWNFPLQSNFVTADWIVYFDLPSSYKDYLISRKYGNFLHNRYFFFINKHESEQKMKLLEGFLELDASLKEVLERKDIDNVESIYKIFRKTAESTTDLTKRFPPFFTKSGKEVNLSNAIAIVNEFCAKLPGDAFTRSAPRWSIRKLKDGAVGKLQLPIESSVKIPIESPPVKNISYIRNITALEAVKTLYELGILDSDLNSTLKNIDRELHDVNLFPYWRDEDNANLRGSGSSFNVVSLNFPEWLTDSCPKAHEPCYLHVIHLEPVYAVPESSRKLYFYEMMKSGLEYGILTRKKLPRVCEFPVYTDLGQVRVRIITNNVVVTPTEEQVDKIFAFHRFVFRDLLNVIKGFLVCDNESAHSSYSIVPVIPESDTVWSIAWDVVYNLSNMIQIYQPTEQELIHTDYFGLNYNGKVVTPWYQALPHRDYIITEVLSDCTPSSSFSSFDYQSYSEYYCDKYGLEVKQPLQPLLEARSVNTNLNCLRPRSQNPGTQRRRGEKIKDFEETLVPEFCILQPFPAVYWYKSMTLLAVLHRLHFSLNAETIRRRFASVTLSDAGYEAGDDATGVLIEDSSCVEELDDLGKPVVPISSILKRVKLARKVRSHPWGYEHLPDEIDKNISTSSLLEIMAYYDFVTPTQKLLTGEINESYKQIPIKSRAENFVLKFLNVDEKLYPGPKQCDIIQALTARQCNDIVNLERLKIVGNAFLNFAASLVLYKLYPDLNSCQLRNLRRKLIGKRNLYYCGSQMELGSFLKLQDISLCCDWNVGGFSVPEVLVNILKNSEVPPEVLFNVELSRDEQMSGIVNSKTRITVNENMINYCNEKIKSVNVYSAEAASTLTENNNHALVYLGKLCVPENAVVNVLKSLVGVYLMSCGVHSTLSLLQKLGLLKQNININDLFSNCDDSNSDGYHFGGFEILCERINYKFKSKKLPYLAFIHHSYFPENHIECNQRLAFLGDAILDVLITSFIHEACGHLSIDHQEDLRICLVNDILYAVLAVRLGLHKFLMYESSYLMEKINEFVRKQERAHHTIRHDDFLYLIEETSSESSGSVDVPKALSDIFKAIIAGVFIDCNGDLKTVWNVCYSLMKNELEKFSSYVPRNPTRLLSDTDLFVEFGSPMACENDDNLVKIVLTIDIDHCRRSFAGIGFSKRQAKIIAAKLALKQLNKNFTL